MKLALTATPTPVPGAPLIVQGDLAAAFALAAELGCDGVELHMAHADDVDGPVVRRLMAAHGQRVPTLGTGMAVRDGLTFADPDAAVRRRAVERVQGHIALAATLGSAVTIGSIKGRLGSDSHRRAALYDAAIACLGECCQSAEAAGVDVLLEPLNRYESDYVNTVAEALQMAAQVGSRRLKLLLDTYHMNIEEVDIAASLRAAGADLGHVHLVDSNRQAPGHGHLDVRSVLDALREMGYAGFLSFEVPPLPTPRQAAEDAVRTVRALLPR